MINLGKLKQAENMFLHRYPGGFNNPEIIAIRRRKHNVDKMIAFTQERFAKRNFKLSELIVQNMIKVVSQSSVIARFEKPKFRHFVDTLFPEERGLLAG